jgi:NADH-quinone oxidoreductase subunit L
MIAFFLPFFVLLPLAGLIASLFLPKKKEKLISVFSISIIGIHISGALVYTIGWLLHDHPSINLKEIVLYQSSGYEFFIDFYFDKVTAVYLVVGSFLTFLVTAYSRYYLHREEGYKRFFNTLLFFFFGYNLVIFSGNLETLFLGYEILGVSSFLLIAFYRQRYLPVKNAVKVFSIYRIADVGLILAMWLSHHFWHENITFSRLDNYELVEYQLKSHSWLGIFISLMILISAAAKSAQLPFSSWLSRAMEGPTPSSAIFYGSLSVHIGAFVLLRTFGFWEHQLSVRILIIVLGISTAIIATLIARVQSSVKSQIAYSSITQIGIIFIEIALGFDDLALFHFAGNAFLRTYQLLVSPSIVSYLIREQFYNFIPHEHTYKESFPKRIGYSIYMFSLKEWNLDTFMYRYLWNPLKRAGNKLRFLNVQRLIWFFIPAYIAGVIFLVTGSVLPAKLYENIPVIFSFIALIMVLKSFTERNNVVMSWLLIIMNHYWIALAVAFNERFTFDHILIYLSGITLAGFVGYFTLLALKRREISFNLNQFHGHSYEHPKMAFIFLIATLGISGFPVTPAFVGEDLIFSHIHEDHVLLAGLTALSLIVDGIAAIRIYARVFLGPHSKSYHEIAYRSS